MEFSYCVWFQHAWLTQGSGQNSSTGKKKSVPVAEKQRGGEFQQFEELMREGLLRKDLKKPKEKTPAE